MSVAAPIPDTTNEPRGLRRAFRNLGVLLGGRALNAPLSLLHASLAIHLLGGYGFGLVVMLYAFARTIGDLVDFQSWQTVLQYGFQPLSDRDLPRFHRILRFSLILDLIGGVAGCAIAVVASLTMGQILGWPPLLRPIGTFYSLTPLFMAAATPTGVLRILNRFDLLAAQGSTATIVRLLGTLALPAIGASFAHLALIWMLAEILSFTVLFGLAWRELHKRELMTGFWIGMTDIVPDLVKGRIAVDFPGIWRFAFITNANATLSLVFSHVTTLIVGSVLGPVSAGYYRIASQIAAGIAKPGTMMQQTLYPEMATLWRDGATGRMYRLAWQSSLAAGGIGCLLMIFALLLGHPLLGLVIGTRDPAAVNIMLWMLGAEIVAICGLPLEPLLMTFRRAGAVVIARCVDVVFFLPVLMILIHAYGLEGVGPANVGGAIVLVLMQLAMALHARRALAPTSSRPAAPDTSHLDPA
ncbi:lipopolysaccharide biosynthesis protein [Gluconacetobacter takamatsuzukensis]|uniref:lipopolysaccharide biosynthesis protein n=1 Tax=Gluconacetobacter takamatsuzukensis TaxID=1286190 RepID=UPI001603F341|nr:lipopolysaccharide biosynthesis protein [Gluconacetobacter takamatsuzukensis]